MLNGQKYVYCSGGGLADPSQSEQWKFGPVLGEENIVSFEVYAPGRSEMFLHLALPGVKFQRCIKLKQREYGIFFCAVSRPIPGTQYWYVSGDGETYPDPWSQFQPEGIHGPSEIVDHSAYVWQTRNWKGLPWHETVIYELHVGAFTPEGTFVAASEQLAQLAALGFTAVQIMPVCAVPEGQNWGYDGVYPYAPDRRFGTPHDFKRFVDRAHQNGLQVFLDVVYNHFGPEGNYLHSLAPVFFNHRDATPWGASLNFDGHGKSYARQFVLNNAFYWLEQFKIDGLRIDAPHMMRDLTGSHILDELNTLISARFKKERHVHVILEKRNEAAASEGFHVVNQQAGHLLSECLTNFKQNDLKAFFDSLLLVFPADREDLTNAQGILPFSTHDDIGNNFQGYRLWQQGSPEAVQLLLSVILMSPQAPLIFMGDERAAGNPFYYFCRFKDICEDIIVKGRSAEFGQSLSSQVRPYASETFTQSVLDLQRCDGRSAAAQAFCSALLAVRKSGISPILEAGPVRISGRHATDSRLEVAWQTACGRLALEISTNRLADISSSNSVLVDLNWVVPEINRQLFVQWSIVK